MNWNENFHVDDFHYENISFLLLKFNPLWIIRFNGNAFRIFQIKIRFRWKLKNFSSAWFNQWINNPYHNWNLLRNVISLCSLLFQLVSRSLFPAKLRYLLMFRIVFLVQILTVENVKNCFFWALVSEKRGWKKETFDFSSKTEGRKQNDSN